MKKIEEAYPDFVKYLNINFPAIRAKFPGTMPCRFDKAPYGTQRPANISETDWQEFLRIEIDWLRDNDVTSKELFRLVGTGLTSLSSENIVSLEAIDNKTTRVVTKESDGLDHTWDINEDLQSIKQRLNIE